MQTFRQHYKEITLTAFNSYKKTCIAKHKESNILIIKIRNEDSQDSFLQCVCVKTGRKLNKSFHYEKKLTYFDYDNLIDRKDFRKLYIKNN